MVLSRLFKIPECSTEQVPVGALLCDYPQRWTDITEKVISVFDDRYKKTALI